MKIGLSSRTLTLGYLDGIGTYTFNLLNQYKILKRDVISVLYPSLKKKVDLENSVYFSLPYCLLSFSNLVFPPINIFTKEIENKIDIYHATDFRIPKLKNTPVVATIHDAAVFRQPQWYRPALRNFKNHVIKKTVSWADRIITVSASMVPEVAEYLKIDASQIDVVHNGITDWWFERVSESEKETVLKKYQLQPEFLLYVGTLQPKKNVSRIIQAYEMLPQELQHKHKLALVGKNGWNTSDLMPKINSLATNNKGAWLQYVSLEELRALYQSAKLFIFPSLHEGFGIPILEAFASNVPVITSKITAMPEVSGEAAYLVDPYQVEDIAQSIEKLLCDVELCKTFISKGSKRVKEFSWQKCAEKTLEVYKKLV